MTEQTIDHNELNEALQRCGSNWNAAQAHGLLCGRLCVSAPEEASRWLEQVLDAVTAEGMRKECGDMLDTLYKGTWRQLVERQSEFTLLLPDDTESLELRTEAMSHWCEGFLHGLVSEKHPDELKKRLAADPLADIIRDMLQMTRAALSPDAADEEDERAFVELVEYLRVAAQLAYEELAEFRDPSAELPTGENETLH